MLFYIYFLIASLFTWPYSYAMLVMIPFCNAFHLYSWRVVYQLHKDIKEKQEEEPNEICQLHVDMSTCDDNVLTSVDNGLTSVDNGLTSVDSVDITREPRGIHSMCGFGCMCIAMCIVYVLCIMMIPYICYSTWQAILRIH